MDEIQNTTELDEVKTERPDYAEQLPMRNKPCWYLGYSLMELRREKPVSQLRLLTVR